MKLCHNLLTLSFYNLDLDFTIPYFRLAKFSKELLLNIIMELHTTLFMKKKYVLFPFPSPSLQHYLTLFCNSSNLVANKMFRIFQLSGTNKKTTTIKPVVITS